MTEKIYTSCGNVFADLGFPIMDPEILIFEKLKKILADNLDCEDTEITLNTDLRNDLDDNYPYVGIDEIFINSRN
jgi:hypothetical protein